MTLNTAARNAGETKKRNGIRNEKSRLLFPHQLFRKHSMFEEVDAVYLVEEDLFFKQYAFHKQKIAFHRASMKALKEDLKAQKKTCHYIDATSRHLIYGS
jgi:deoxyribodipyrimidine photolyase-related protein